MDRCPVCNAKYNNKGICRRCKADLEPLADLEKKSANEKDKAVLAYRNGDFKEMFFHAKRAASISYTPASARLLACSALLTKKFDLAFFLWKKDKISGQPFKTESMNYKGTSKIGDIS